LPRNKRKRFRHYHVTLLDVLQAHDEALKFGGLPGVTSLALVASAIARPYCGYYRTISRKAAALSQSLAKNHGFLDGNKRTALLAITLLVTHSGYEMVAVKNDIVKELENMILDVVNDRMSLDGVEAWFYAHIKKPSWVRRLLRSKSTFLRRNRTR
jgi:death-on-curing protein